MQISGATGRSYGLRVTSENAAYIAGVTTDLFEYAMFDKSINFTAHSPLQAFSATSRALIGYLRNDSSTEKILLRKLAIHWNGGTQATTTYSAPLYFEVEAGLSVPTGANTTGAIKNRDLKSGKISASTFMYGTAMTGSTGGVVYEYEIGGVGENDDSRDAGYILNPLDSIGLYAYVDAGVTGKIGVSFDFIQTDFAWFEA